MNLKSWIDGERGRAAALAAFLAEHEDGGKKISPAMVYQWCSDNKKIRRGIPVRWCPLIEVFTKGEVMRWDSCPDKWHLMWPELKRRKDAPKIG